MCNYQKDILENTGFLLLLSPKDRVVKSFC